MNLQLQNKVIIVTGGAKGIGAGIVKTLAEENAIPVIIGRNETDNKKLADELITKGYQADHITAELSNPVQCHVAVSEVVKRFERIDGLVNNAGVNDGVGLANGNYESFVASLHKNLVHYYLMAHYALPELIKSKGAIVNIGSKTAETGQGCNMKSLFVSPCRICLKPLSFENDCRTSNLSSSAASHKSTHPTTPLIKSY